MLYVRTVYLNFHDSLTFIAEQQGLLVRTQSLILRRKLRGEFIARLLLLAMPGSGVLLVLSSAVTYLVTHMSLTAQPDETQQSVAHTP